MGKIQCVSSSRQSHNWEFLENLLNKANSPLENKIKTEYFKLKESIEEEENNLTGGINKILFNSKRKLISYISNEKKFERLKKWFKLSNIVIFIQLENTQGTFIKEIKELECKKSNRYVNLDNPVNQLNLKNKNDDNYKTIKNFHINNDNDKNNILFDLSEIERSSHSNKSNNKEVMDKYFTNSNGISSIELVENELIRDNISESEKSLEQKVKNKIDRNSFISLLIEKNIRKFYTNNSERFLERVFKGPPDSFRWLSWLICAEIPECRQREFFLKNYLEKIDEKTDNQIKKDLNRTIMEISLSKYSYDSSIDKFCEEDPTLNYLYRVLRAFSNNDKEVSYCQGMNFIAGFILIVSEFNETETFYMLIALFSETFGTKFGIRGFFSENFPLLKAYIFIFNHFFQKKMPQLKEHFKKLEIPDEVWISKWIQTLFTICLPIDATMRVWDCIMSDGLEFLISFSIAFVKNFEEDLLKLGDSFEVIEFFRNIFTGKNDKEEEHLINVDNNCNPSNNKKINSKDINKNLVKENIKQNKLTHESLNKNSNRVRKYSDIENNKAINNSKGFINLEDIISKAKKLQINKNTVNLIKKEYQTKFHVDLSYLHKIYDMNSVISLNSASDSKSVSAIASDSLPKSKLSNISHNLPQSMVQNINVKSQLMNEKSTGLTNASNTNMVVIKENSENINIHMPMHMNINMMPNINKNEIITSCDDEFIVTDDSVNSIEIKNTIKIRSFKTKDSLK
jgi:hypothetical protein